MLHSMDSDAASLALAIGARVKQERKARDWTLDQLADAADVSRRMVVNVEQGSVNPSVGTLLRLADALGVGLPALVEPPNTRAARLTRSGEGAVLWQGNAGGRGVLVAATEPPDIVELWDWTINVGEQHKSEAHSAGTRELVQVQSGALTITVGDDSYTLETGDALSFHGDTAHTYVNLGKKPVSFSLAVFEPGVGATRKPEAHNG